MARKTKSAPKSSPWDVLGLAPGATRQEIDKAWKKCAFDNHPDRNLDDEAAAARFKVGSAAYEELTGRAPEADPVEQLAITVISQATANAFSAMLKGGRVPKDTEVAGEIRKLLQESLDAYVAIVDGTRKGIARIEEALGRFTGPHAPLMEDIVGGHVLADAKRQLESAMHNVRAGERAMEIFADVGFRQDEAAKMGIVAWDINRNGSATVRNFEGWFTR